MTHYEKEKWILYKKNLLNDKETINMEEHLYTCDDCMDTFLNLIDSEEISIAENLIPTDFTEKIMDKIDSAIQITGLSSKVKSNSINNVRSKTTRKKKMIENIFMYYVAAASVVLVLTAGGVFTKMTEFPIENIAVDSERTNEGLGKVYNFSERITNGTNNFINNLGMTNREKTDQKNDKIFNKKLIKKQGGQ